MFTDEQLKQLKELFKPVNDKLDSLDNKVGTLDNKVDTLEMKIEAVNERTARIEKKLDGEVTDIAETEREILVRLDKLDELETCVTALEGKPPQHKN